MNRYLSRLFTHKHVLASRNLSSGPKITTHYTVVPRETDPRWKDIDMERAVDETDVSSFIGVKDFHLFTYAC